MVINSYIKRAEDLTVDDLIKYPVWQYANEDEKGETGIFPIKRIPVKNLDGRLAGIQVRLASGPEIWATIENVDTENPRFSEHFLTLSVFREGRWFTMARYHDFDSNERGPQALASFLGLRIDEVFPISYDISRLSLGDKRVLVGMIETEPREKLTRSQIIALAVP